MKLFITGPIMPTGIDILKKTNIDFEIWTENRAITQDELIAKCKDADGVLCAGFVKFDQAFFDACSHLKVVSLHSVGYDIVDLKAADQYKIPVGNTPGVLSAATADIAFLLMLATSRKAFFNFNRLQKGDFKYMSATDNLGIELEGKTLGVWGLGKIGFEMAKKCKLAYGMKVIYHNRKPNLQAEKELNATMVSFEELLLQSDVLSLHVNLTDETRNIFDKNAFKKMRSNAILVNTGRGALVNEADLLAAIDAGEIWGAGLDVTNPEPMHQDNPLLTHPKVCVLPHIGSATEETRSEMARIAVENAIAGLEGKKLPHVVNPEVYE